MIVVGKKRRCIIIMADGARYDVMKELISDAQLPNIQDVFLKKGSFLQGVTVFPSTTGPAYLPYLTGCFPGTCNMPGIRWFDRREYGSKVFSWNKHRSYVGLDSMKMNSDVKDGILSLHDLLDKTYNIFSAIHKGCKNNLHQQTKLWTWYYCHITDRWATADRLALKYTLRALEKDFDFLFTLFPAIDVYSHRSSPHSDIVKETYIELDRSVGKIRDKLIAENKFEETLLFIVSDHGLTQCHTHFGVDECLEEDHEIKTFYYPQIFKWNFDAATAVSGNAMCHLYFKTGKSWIEETSFKAIENKYPKLIHQLLNEPSIGLLIAKAGEGWIDIRKGDQHAQVKEEEGRLFYRRVSGDPLQVGDLPLEMSFAESFDLTLSCPYPDALLQITQIFRSPRTGDIILSAENGFDLRDHFEDPEHKASHGSFHEEVMRVPILCNIPSSREAIRTVDVFPTILKELGIPISHSIDGVAF